MCSHSQRLCSIRVGVRTERSHADLCVTSVSPLIGALILSKTFKIHGKVIHHPPNYPDSSHTGKQRNVRLLGVKRASGQAADLLTIKLQVVQLNT